VSLATDAINGNTGRYPGLDFVDHALSLGVAGLVQIVVVDVQLRIRIRSPRSREGNLDEILAEHIVEDRAPERAILIKDLVDDVPSIDLALILAHDLVDVVLHGRLKGCLISDGRHPAGKLTVPHGGVATQKLAVVGGELDSLVRCAEVETTLGALGCVPLHAACCEWLDSVVGVRTE